MKKIALTLAAVAALGLAACNTPPTTPATTPPTSTRPRSMPSTTSTAPTSTSTVPPRSAADNALDSVGDAADNAGERRRECRRRRRQRRRERRRLSFAFEPDLRGSRAAGHAALFLCSRVRLAGRQNADGRQSDEDDMPWPPCSPALRCSPPAAAARSDGGLTAEENAQLDNAAEDARRPRPTAWSPRIRRSATAEAAAQTASCRWTTAMPTSLRRTACRRILPDICRGGDDAGSWRSPSELRDQASRGPPPRKSGDKGPAIAPRPFSFSALGRPDLEVHSAHAAHAAAGHSAAAGRLVFRQPRSPPLRW